MTVALISRIVVALLACSFVAFYCYRFIVVKAGFARTMMSRFLIALLVLFIAALYAMPRPFTWPIRSIGVAAFCYGAYLMYIIDTQLIRDKLHQSIVRTRSFLFVTLSVLLETGLIFLERDNLGSLIDAEPFHPTVGYFAYYLLIFLIPAVTCVLALRIFREVDWDFRGFIFSVRYFFSISAWVMFLTWCVLGLVDTLAYIAFGDRFQSELNKLVHLTRPAIFLIAIPVFMPVSVLSKLTKPLERFAEPRRRRQHEALRYLHERTRQVVQCIEHLPAEFQSLRWLVTELGDQREVVWSHLPHRWFVSARREARFLYDLLRENRGLREHGPYAIHPPRYNSIRHNLAVARHLRRLEGQSALPQRPELLDGPAA